MWPKQKSVKLWASPLFLSLPYIQVCSLFFIKDEVDIRHAVYFSINCMQILVKLHLFRVLCGFGLKCVGFWWSGLWSMGIILTASDQRIFLSGSSRVLGGFKIKIFDLGRVKSKIFRLRETVFVFKYIFPLKIKRVNRIFKVNRESPLLSLFLLLFICRLRL